MQGKYLETLTWEQAERALEHANTLLLPLGARSKEHGPHLPLNNDWLIAEYLAMRVAEQCGVLVLPTLQYGYYPAFCEYPGSISLGEETCRDMVVDIHRSFQPHCQLPLYVLNTGHSTVAPLLQAQRILGEEGLRMDFTDPTVAFAPLRQKVETQPAGSHADEIETSMMLYIAPEIVQMKRAQRDIHPSLGPGGLTRDPLAKTGTYSATGAYGDPTLASVEKGEIIVEGMVDYLVGHMQRFIPEPRRMAPLTLPSTDVCLELLDS